MAIPPASPRAERAASGVLAAVQSLRPAVAEAIPRMDRDRRMPMALVKAMDEAGIFRMALPRAYGGAELDPMAHVRVVEEVSALDGSTGWIAMIGAAGGYQGAFLEPAVAQRLLGAPGSICAGQTTFTGQRAEVVNGGFRLSGRFRFASGCQHASVLTCGVALFKDGSVVRTDSGRPPIRMLMVPAAKANIIETWDTTGMRGTGSHDYTVEDVFVPSEESYSPLEPPKLDQPLYGFAPLFLAGHAGVALGIARGALDGALELSNSKVLPPQGQLLRDDTQAQECIGQAETTLAAARCYVYAALEEIWETLRAGHAPSAQQRAGYRMMIVHAHQAARQVVASIVDLAATSAVIHNSVFDRAMRDIVTACQHRQAHMRLYRPAGRVYLGMDSGIQLSKPQARSDFQLFEGRPMKFKLADRLGSHCAWQWE